MKAVLFCLVLSFSTLVLVSESATTRLTYSRWINLLRYAHSSLQRDPTAVEDRQYNRTDHVQLIADSILKHFFNDIFTRKSCFNVILITFNSNYILGEILCFA